ncbi:type III restriction-modification system endonuclease [Candidatus Methanarcanum hacksteinii]|uniref:type III restriction-modification system endonuclease n=1 Tax=Candidatus Methanarcanum hacksteinii TaxID=2911857 RepID=UPI0037DCBB65
MRFNFKIQPYQTDAVESIVDVFEGECFDDSNTYVFDMGAYYNRLLKTKDVEAYSNHPLTLEDDQLLDNIKRIQRSSDISISKDLDNTLGKCSLDIEMETGTGKTYVYIKTMFELNKRYGWSKFIVVVPSIAIREGVRKTFEITQNHFMEHYQKKARFFVYDSSNLQMLDDFSRRSGINVMIINSQAFASSLKEGGTSKESRIIYSVRDEFQSRRPIDVIAANNPIIILDEPQKLSGKATQDALKKNFNALFSMNFSATHKVNHNLIYSLDALDAYNQKLVKKIEVKGIETKNLAGTSCYIYLDDIVLDSKLPPRIRIEMEISYSNGVRRDTRILSQGDNLYIESRNLETYRDVFVTHIDPNQNYVEFSNGLKLSPGEVNGDTSEENLRRIQIRETILSHFEKENQLFKKGIKCLSLFFIDQVDNYRQYDESGNPILGPFGKMFEEEYSRILNERGQFFEPEYIEYVKSIPIESTHRGYFSIDKKTKRNIDSPIKGKSEYSDDVDAYDLILKDKERLLSFEEPTRFIFSHSALSEGWDNPNVFQICALKHSDSSIRKRQEVGRGLRLCVNSNGERMDLEECGNLIHDINKLTVIASEGYDSFVKDLQKEISEDLRERPTKIDKDLLSGMRVTIEGEGKVISGEVANKIYHQLIRLGYIDDSDMPTEDCRKAIESGIAFFDSTSELAAYNDAAMELVRIVVEGGTLEGMIDDGKKTRIKENRLNDNFNRKEFQALWHEINHKYTYRVEYDSQELIRKSIKSINDSLFVSRLSYIITSGNQDEQLNENDLKKGKAFEKKKQETKELVSSGSSVKYDLVGEIATGSTITRNTAVEILKGIEQKKFDMFRQNPEEFITKVCKLIKDAKATMIVDHITYNRIDETYDSSIFTESKTSCDPMKAFEGTKHILDYVFTDGLAEDSVERRFAESLDKAEEVAVYAKLPKGFKIPTPVGNYSPDWAIAFDDSHGIKHIFFIAETKGSMDSMQLKPIEKAKIHCAEKIYNVPGSNVRYHHVDTYENLLKLIKDMD